MGPVLSALVVLSALAASAALLVHLVVSEGRRRDQRGGIRRHRPPAPRPPAHPRVQPPPVAQPASGAVWPGPGAAWTPTLSNDGAWAWTGSGWVPARWGAVGAAPPRPSRSHGCVWGAGVGCVLLLGIAGLFVLVVLVLLAGLASLLATALGG
jgi:hypothetical protein